MFDTVDANYDLKTYDFEVDDSIIASRPYEKRDSASLLVCSRSSGAFEKTFFGDIERFFMPGDMLVLNETKVFKARLLGVKVPTGARVEVFLLKRREGCVFEALVRPARRMRPGVRVQIGDGPVEAVVLERTGEDGVWIVEIVDGRGAGADVFDVIEEFGHVPLPPYILKKKDSDSSEDVEGYQTVYASRTGSVAAPTAGLHFTGELLERLSAAGVSIVKLALHVGIGTFKLVESADIRGHRMHRESFEMSAAAYDSLRSFLGDKKGGRLFCCGTTSVRAVESLDRMKREGPAGCYSGETDLFIYPGYSFRNVDAMITNFHLPRSTLFMMVSAFMGAGKAREAYEFAKNSGFRFFSYGDAMLIV